MSIIYGRADSEKQLLSNYPSEVKTIHDIPLFHEKYKRHASKKETGIFAKLKTWNKRRKLAKFEKNLNNPFHAGAKGENMALEVLSFLGDEYHILCGVRINLPRPVRYNGIRGLMSAQMDFVVVSKKGVFVVEVKNWTDNFFRKHDGLSPHEQTERAGRVLWIELNRLLLQVRVSTILVSISGNIPYDRKYKNVLVCGLDRINELISNRQDSLSNDQIKKIVGHLKYYVTV